MAPAKQQEKITAISSMAAIPIPTYLTRLMLSLHQSSKAFTQPTVKAWLPSQVEGLFAQQVDGMVMPADV